MRDCYRSSLVDGGVLIHVKVVIEVRMMTEDYSQMKHQEEQGLHRAGKVKQVFLLVTKKIRRLDKVCLPESFSTRVLALLGNSV
jgi:hypothetical protein